MGLTFDATYSETDLETGNTIILVEAGGKYDWALNSTNALGCRPRFSLAEAVGMLPESMQQVFWQVSPQCAPRVLARLILLDHAISANRSDGAEDTLP